MMQHNDILIVHVISCQNISVISSKPTFAESFIVASAGIRCCGRTSRGWLDGHLVHVPGWIYVKCVEYMLRSVEMESRDYSIPWAICRPIALYVMRYLAVAIDGLS